MKLIAHAKAYGKKITLISAAFVLAVSSISAAVPFMLAQRAAALPGAGTYTVSGNTSAAENSEGWMFNRDTANATPTSFVGGHSSIGVGSLYVEPLSNTVAAKKFIGENFILSEMNNINLISFDYKLGPATNANEVYMNVYANFGGTSITNFYDCRYDIVALTGSTTAFSTLTFDPTQSYTVTTRGTSPHACPSVPSDMNDLADGSTIRAYAVTLGGTSLSDAGMSAYFDNSVVATTTGTIVYDFEPYVPACNAGDTTFDTFSTGSVNGQHGWKSTGSYDQSVVYNTSGHESLGCKALRISNAVASGSFGDQTFSYSTANEAGETSAENGGHSSGTRQNHFEASWDFTSASPTSEQAGLSVVASPDRGDGARMSWIQMKDTPTGLEVWFYEYVPGAPNTGGGAGFVLSEVASGLSRSAVHNIKVTIDFVDGAANDVVKVYVNGELKKTGNSWEDYFRIGEVKPTRTVDSVLFRASGTAAPALAGKGFLIDNVNISTQTILAAGPTLIAPSDSTVYRTAHLPQTQQWTAVPGATKYVYESYTVDPVANPSATPAHTETRSSTSRTIGTTAAEGKYWWRVKASAPFVSDWSDVRTFSVDNSAPTVSIDTPTGSLYNANVQVRATVTDENLRHYWVQVKRNGSVVHQNTILSSGINNQSVYTATTEGAYTVTVAARDKAGGTDTSGNRSADVVKTFTVDKTAPAVPAISFPNPGQYFNTGNILNQWNSVSDTLSGVNRYEIAYNYIDGHNFAIGNSSWTTMPTPAGYSGVTRYISTGLSTSRTHKPAITEQGGVTIWVRAVDNAGNASEWSAPVTYHYDATAPTVPTISMRDANNDNVSSGSFITTQNFTFNLGSDSDTTRYQLKYWNDIPSSSFKAGSPWNPTDLSGYSSALGVYHDQFSQGEGTHYFAFSACDLAGNCSAYSAPFAVTYDYTGITVAADTFTITNNVITPNVTTDETPVSQLWTQTAGPAGGVTISDPTALTPTFTVVQDGTYEFKLAVFDAAGNESTGIFSFSYTTPITPVVDTNNGGDNSGDGDGEGDGTNDGGFIGPAFTPGGSDQLGASDDADDNSGVDGASTEKNLAEAINNTDGSAFGLAWYWWLLLVAGGAAGIWWLIAAIRGRSAE